MKNILFFTVMLMFLFLSNACFQTSRSLVNAALHDEEDMNKIDLYGSNPINEITANDIVRNIRIGWNLGNTLDTAELEWLNSSSISDFEKAWGNPVTTRRNIETVKNAGFNAIRIPVSWSKCVDSEYNIRRDWMRRVKEVVDYAVSSKLIIILNTHHDESIFKYIDSEMEESKKAFKKIWEQIADNFKYYGAYLIFESLNEPRTKGLPTEWTGGTAPEHENLNIMNQIFVDAVRASGGNNAYRILMIPAYSASPSQLAMNGLKIPNDTAGNKIIISIHVYEPYRFVSSDQPVVTWDGTKSSDTSPVTAPVDRAYNTFASKGIPVIIGEFGAANKDNEAVRADWAQFNVSYAKSKGIPCVWWDDGGDLKLFDRRSNSIVYPQIVEKIMQGVK